MNMTTGGWIFLVLSWGVILSLVLFCYSKIISDKEDTSGEDTYPRVK